MPLRSPASDIFKRPTTTPISDGTIPIAGSTSARYDPGSPPTSSSYHIMASHAAAICEIVQNTPDPPCMASLIVRLATISHSLQCGIGACE